VCVCFAYPECLYKETQIKRESVYEIEREREKECVLFVRKREREGEKECVYCVC